MELSPQELILKTFTTSFLLLRLNQELGIYNQLEESYEKEKTKPKQRYMTLLMTLVTNLKKIIP